MIDAIRIVDEQVFVDPDDVVDPDETQGEARHQHEVVQFYPQRFVLFTGSSISRDTNHMTHTHGLQTHAGLAAFVFALVQTIQKIDIQIASDCRIKRYQEISKDIKRQSGFLI